MAGKVKKGTFGFQSFTTKDIRKALAENNPKYTLIGEYRGYKELHRFKHVCGNVIECIAGPITRGFGKTCPCTHKRINYRTLEIRQIELLEVAGKDYLCTKFEKGKAQSSYKHICGHEWQADFVSFQKRGKYACPKCFGKFGHSLTQEEIRARLQETPYKLVRYNVGTKGCQIQHEFEHTCGTRFKHQVNELLAVKVTACPSCKNQLYAYKEIMVDGHMFQVRGAEDKALCYMTTELRIKPKFTVNKPEDGLPTFLYRYSGKIHRYTPDFYVRNRNLVVEVKSYGTLGLMNSRRYKFFNYATLTRARVKAKAVTEAGYKFLLILSHRGNMISLPNAWINWNKQELRSYLRTI